MRSKAKTVFEAMVFGSIWNDVEGWRRKCHAYAAIGVPGISRKFGGPTLQGEAFQFEKISSMIESLIYGYSWRAPRLVLVSDRQHCRENTHDEFRG